MDRVGVTSSSVASVGYAAETGTLELEYRNGSVYEYFAVPRSVFDSLLAAGSKGTFVSAWIRGRYPYRRVAG